MSVCEPCKDAADGVDFGPILVCSICGVGPVSVYRTDVPLAEQSVVRHKREVAGVKIWCEGGTRPPREQSSHDFCRGCTCQHRAPGSWKGKKS